MALPDASITAALTTEEQCIAYLEELRWPGGIACPNCGKQKISRFQAKGKSGKVRQICQCLDRECKYQFSATTGTIFHDSHLALSKWFEAMRLHVDGEALSINQLRFALDVQYKTAKNVSDRIQQAFSAGTIELDSATKRTDAPSRKTAAAVRIKRAEKSTEAPTEIRQPKQRAPVPPPVATGPTMIRAHGSSAIRTPKPDATPTVVDSMLSVFTSALNLSVKPPLAAVKYMKKKILD
jgi:hypothetical protein